MPAPWLSHQLKWDVTVHKDGGTAHYYHELFSKTCGDTSKYCMRSQYLFTLLQKHNQLPTPLLQVIVNYCRFPPVSSLQEIEIAKQNGAIFHTQYNGFEERNQGIAKLSDRMIAFTYSQTDEPPLRRSGTRSTWNHHAKRCGADRRHHFSLPLGLTNPRTLPPC